MTSTVTIGGGAAPATIFDRFRAKALDLDRSKFASLDGATLVGIEGNTIRIGADAAFHVERLRSRQPELEALATKLFGKATRITVEIAVGDARREQVGQRASDDLQLVVVQMVQQEGRRLRRRRRAARRHIGAKFEQV